jgi:hypothetical protein
MDAFLSAVFVRGRGMANDEDPHRHHQPVRVIVVK